MTYMLLIYSPNTGHEPTEEEWMAMLPPYLAYNEYVHGTGCFVDGAPLAGLSTATTVRVRDGKRAITDGPFAETKEFLAGYYMLNCASLDEALEIAAKCPAAEFGSIEVRPVMEMPAPV